jgi:hypothetical protein
MPNSAVAGQGDGAGPSGNGGCSRGRCDHRDGWVAITGDGHAPAHAHAHAIGSEVSAILARHPGSTHR